MNGPNKIHMKFLEQNKKMWWEHLLTLIKADPVAHPFLLNTAKTVITTGTAAAAVKIIPASREHIDTADRMVRDFIENYKAVPIRRDVVMRPDGTTLVSWSYKRREPFYWWARN